MHAHGGGDLVDLKNAMVVPFELGGFSFDAPAVLLGSQQSHPGGILIFGGYDEPTSMEWRPLADDVYGRLTSCEGDADSTLNKCVEKTIARYKKLFGEPPKEYSSPLAENGQPELDDSALLEPEDQSVYVYLVSSLQFLVTLGHLDIQQAVAAVCPFCLAPRQVHMERVTHIFGYVKKYNDTAVSVPELPQQNYD
mmetsp:Transcript_17906/g.38936  ORF Transcript_17906/g.38936 Transcript_17906/m.38936 type:complete len:195 (-) Transcript_17906:61-645(-)